jgi:pSer/pThr/pTyr-binding forkhead associated (FHA) protein
MNPRLTAIAGRLKGSVFTIEDLPVVIGRETNATLCIADASVSRRHSRIDKEEDEFVILDLDSLNGTFINDVPVKRRKLQHGDRVRIGDSQFLFLMHESARPRSSSDVHLNDGKIVSGSTLQVRFNDALYLMARDLSALMKVSTTINAIRSVEELQKTLLELLFEVVPAERGAIFLAERIPAAGEEAQFISVFGLHRTRGPDESIKVSRTITRSVLNQGEALLINNQPPPTGLESESLITDRPNSILCVPLIMLDRTLGVIYLDTREPDTFDVCHFRNHSGGPGERTTFRMVSKREPAIGCRLRY